MAVTAWHVVQDAKRVVAKFSTGEEFEVSGIVDKDEARDVAVIRVKVFGRPSLPTIATDPPIGAKAFVIGSPKGLDFSFSDGLVSQIQTLDGVKQYQFTCAASPGNSGGPLINAKGEVIGVVSWQLRDSQNLNFAVPITYVLGLDLSLPTQPWETVKSNGPIVAKSGGNSTSVEEFDTELADALIVQQDANVLVEWIEANVFRRGDGYKSGMPTLGYALRSDLEVRAAKLTDTVAPDKVRAKWRNVTVMALKDLAEQLDLYSKAIKGAQIKDGYPPVVVEILREARAIGLREASEKLTKEDIETLSASKTFGDALPVDMKIMWGFLPNDEGYSLGVYYFPRVPTTLTLVTENSLARQIGLKEGDKVIGADGKNFDSLHDFKMFIKSNLGKKLKVTVRREGKIQDITLKIPSLLPKK